MLWCLLKLRTCKLLLLLLFLRFELILLVIMICVVNFFMFMMNTDTVYWIWVDEFVMHMFCCVEMKLFLLLFWLDSSDLSDILDPSFIVLLDSEIWNSSCYIDCLRIVEYNAVYSEIVWRLQGFLVSWRTYFRRSTWKSPNRLRYNLILCILLNLYNLLI